MPTEEGNLQLFSSSSFSSSFGLLKDMHVLLRCCVTSWAMLLRPRQEKPCLYVDVVFAQSRQAVSIDVSECFCSCFVCFSFIPPPGDVSGQVRNSFRCQRFKEMYIAFPFNAWPRICRRCHFLSLCSFRLQSLPCTSRDDQERTSVLPSECTYTRAAHMSICMLLRLSFSRTCVSTPRPGTPCILDLPLDSCISQSSSKGQ